jgi:effector-binding domain-containing protein
LDRFYVYQGEKMDIIREPRIDKRPEQPYMGIRIISPFSGMSAMIGKISREMHSWAAAHDVKPVGPPFVRFHVIDMRGKMEITYGIPVDIIVPGDDRVTSDVLVAGRYASLVYMNGGIAGNRALIEWVRGQGMDFDRWDTLAGDNFRCRYESYLTDPKLEPRKTRWHIEVAIKLAD